MEKHLMGEIELLALAERTMRADILAACPDCGSASAVWAYQTKGRWPRPWEVICKGCYPEIGFIGKGLTKAEAINQWNVRARASITRTTGDGDGNGQ